MYVLEAPEKEHARFVASLYAKITVGKGRAAERGSLRGERVDCPVARSVAELRASSSPGLRLAIVHHQLTLRRVTLSQYIKLN